MLAAFGSMVLDGQRAQDEGHDFHRGERMTDAGRHAVIVHLLCYDPIAVASFPIPPTGQQFVRWQDGFLPEHGAG